MLLAEQRRRDKNSPGPAASRTRTSSARPAARTPASSVPSARVLSASNPSGNGRPTSLAAASPRSRVGRRVRLDDLLGGRVDDQHRLRGHLEEKAVTRLDVAQPPVIALHGLLGVHEPLLERGDGPQVSPQGDYTPVLTELHRRVEQRYVGTRRVTDDSPGATSSTAVEAASRSSASTFGRLSIVTVSTQGWPSHFGTLLERELVAAERDVTDHAAAVDDERDIRRGRDQGRSNLGIETGQGLLGCFELLHDQYPINICARYLKVCRSRSSRCLALEQAGLRPESVPAVRQSLSHRPRRRRQAPGVR